MNAGEFPRGRRRRFPISARDYEALSLISIDTEASSIDNWRELGGSFERVIGPGSWNEPGLKVTFCPDLCHEPGLKAHGALVPAVR
jgi:hypothetical protein